MGGIVLVTKPPCLFPSVAPSDTVMTTDDDVDNSTFMMSMVNDYLDRDFEVFQLQQAQPVNTWPLYSVGAVIGLSTAMCTAAYCCLTSKLETPTSVQLLYIGVFCLPLAPIALLVSDTNRFFDGGVADITHQDWMALVGVTCTGLTAFYLELKALTLVPPSVFATLRTSQILVAFSAQCVINQSLPSIVDVAGAGLVFISAVAIVLEPQLTSRLRHLQQQLHSHTTAS